MAPRKKLKFGIIIGYDKAIIDRITQGVPEEVRRAAVNRGLPAAAEVVEKKAKQLAPDGRKTGTSNRQTGSARTKWYPYQLKDMIESKVLDDMRGTVVSVMVGPRRPWGNKANFISPLPNSKTGNTKEQVYWGKRTFGPGNRNRKTNRFLEDASHQTRPQQVRALVTAMRRTVARNMERLKRFSLG